MTNSNLSDRLPTEMLTLPQRAVAYVKENFVRDVFVAVLALQVASTAFVSYHVLRSYNQDYCRNHSGRSPFIIDPYIKPSTVMTPWTFQRCDKVLEAEKK